MYNIFIDGQAGTTGLRLAKRLSARKDINLLTISDDLRKDTNERKCLIDSSDITFLCLPDEAAREAVSLAGDSNVRIIDASTAHRTHKDWLYGFPELSTEHRLNLKDAKRVSVPGCHASGFNAIVYPLVKSGIVPQSYPFVCYSVTGYSGGGKSMIAEYEASERQDCLFSPRQYALSQSHKHLPEMKGVPGLLRNPLFSPIVADFHSGMVVSVPLFSDMLEKRMTAKDVHEFFCEYYGGQEMIKLLPFGGDENESGFFAASAMSGMDNMEILVSGNDERILVATRFDNLGKGASGAALQCMNIMLDFPQTQGLTLKC